MNETTFFILYGVQLAAYVTIFLVQKSQITSIKSKFEASEQFVKLLDMDKLKDFVQLSNDKERLIAFAQIKREFADYEAKTGREYNEMFTFICDILMKLPLESRKEVVSKNLPHMELLFLKKVTDENNASE